MKKTILILAGIFTLSLTGCGKSTPPATSAPDSIENCVNWFNGCNSCFVENGKIAGCDERYCDPDQYETPRCLKYKETNSNQTN